MSLSQSPPPAPLRRRSSASPAPTTGVKVVTRKVIRTLEGLGHAMEDDRDEEAEVVDETEVAAVLRADKRQGKQRAVADKPVVKKIDWEIPRKVFHSSIGFITLGLYLTPSMSPRVVTVVLWSALTVIAPTDVVRLRVPAVERVYERLLGFLMRESERTGTNGTLWYILGVNFALTFYPIDVATVAILILSWADTAASTLGRMYGPRTPPLPASISLAWLPQWVWVPRFLLAAPSPSPSSTIANGHANGNGNANGHIKENPKGLRITRRLKTPFAPRKSTAGFAAACVTGALVALAFWLGIAGLRGVKGVAEMRAVAEGVPGASGYHSQYSIAGQYLRSEAGAWARRWVPEGLIGGVAPTPFTGMVSAQTQHATTPARFGVGGVLGLVALVVCAGVVSGVAEALDLGGLDDNLTLPIISGGALMLFFRVWGWAVGAA
ncbi:hypothetical protein MVEN_02359100 [Mycena venus]|uniref:Phosphatidate cytidylyltransferase n=1 Tax=Mycena venus TaxID=2733690 RepID=A0A8H7CEW5_9AGAR|nr:hypothetical protein MVEN_02359100 [Mycena venus]